jgi:hypothetical protein
VACFDRHGKLRREKRKGARTWSNFKYDEMNNQEEGEGEEQEQQEEDDENDLQNLSVTGRNAVRPKKRVAECAPPDNDEKTRWTGIGPEPSDIPHAKSTELWHADSYYAVEGIVDERKTPEGTSEYKVRWRGYGPEHDTWRTEQQFSAGSSSLIRNWRERSKRVRERAQISANERKSRENDKESKEDVQPINRTNIREGDTVAVLASGSAAVPFYLAKVLAVHTDQQKLRVHWFKSQAADGNYLLEYKPGRQQQPPRLPGTVGARPQHKARATPNTALIWEHTVIDTAPSMRAKQRGKLSRADLTRLLALAAEGQSAATAGNSQ